MLLEDIHLALCKSASSGQINELVRCAFVRHNLLTVEKEFAYRWLSCPNMSGETCIDIMNKQVEDFCTEFIGEHYSGDLPDVLSYLMTHETVSDYPTAAEYIASKELYLAFQNDSYALKAFEVVLAELPGMLSFEISL